MWGLRERYTKTTFLKAQGGRVLFYSQRQAAAFAKKHNLNFKPEKVDY